MRVLDVLEATAYIKELVEFDPVLSDIWVRGEITNLSTSAAGHSYFSLSGYGVQLNCVLFRGNRARLMASPINGESVLAHGRFGIYESRGQYQLIVDNIAPEGMGILQLQYEDTKRRLDEEGLFSNDRKRPLPQIPHTVGVVTSEHGAVWHDIQHVIARRFPLVRLILSPSSVQGINAPGELIAALKALEEAGPDVIILGRGGGSMEDLACFSDEQLARSIYACSVPVISAVGHETDVCIADLVSDLRAPTPSAAAELCVPDMKALLHDVDQFAMDARDAAVESLRSAQAELSAVQGTIRYSSPITRVTRYQQDVDRLASDASSRVVSLISGARATVDVMHDRAQLLNPAEVLRRGYAVVTARDGDMDIRLNTAVAAVLRNRIAITFSDGDIVAQPLREES